MLTFSAAVAMYDRHLRAKRRKPTTLTWYAEQFGAYRRWLDANQRGDVLPDAATVDAFLADQHTAGLRPATVHARFRALRALLLFLEKRRLLSHDANPVHVLDAPSVPREVRRHVTVTDLQSILSAITGTEWIEHRDRLILGILYYSGLRLAELCALTVADIDHASQSITVRAGKGDKARIVPTTPEVLRHLVAYLYSRPNHTDALLLASDGYGGYTGALKSEGVRQMLIRRCRRAGIEPPFSPHAFRHGFAMWTLNAGVRLTTVAALMGHSDPTITHQIYAHTTVVTVRREYEEALRKSRNE